LLRRLPGGLLAGLLLTQLSHYLLGLLSPLLRGRCFLRLLLA
jgi:hypothetical protein